VKDWVEWHRQYDSDGPLGRRLAIVQRHIRDVLGSRGNRPTAVVSMCSGDGRDLLGVLAELGPGGANVTGRLVELDPTLAQAARERIGEAAIIGLQVLDADAGATSAYVGAVPADLVLACGVFGNVPDADIERTVRALPMLCGREATVIWTRGRREPDLTPAIRGWFREAGFTHVAFDPVPDSLASIGVERFMGSPLPLQPGLRLFEFSRSRTAT
jgi:hypothetical protein